VVASSTDGMGLDPNLGYCNGGSCGGPNLKHFFRSSWGWKIHIIHI